MKYKVRNEFMEKIQIDYGIVLNVLKYKKIGYSLYSTKFDKSNVKRIAPGVYQSKVEFTDNWKGTSYLPGTYFIDRCPVELVDKDQYQYELKIAGGTVVGDFNEIIEILNKVIQEVKESFN